MAMHLARHAKAAHGPAKPAAAKVAVKKKARRAAKRARKVVAKKAAGRTRSPVNLAGLSIDRLLALRKAVDGRLSAIVAEVQKVVGG